MSTPSLRKKPANTSPAMPAKYLTFALGTEEYGIDILRVREIIGHMHITAVPQTPHYVEGVINLRGQVIPVFDLRKRLGMASAEKTRRTCIIVVDGQRQPARLSTGLVVDQVLEVREMRGEDVEPPPALGASLSAGFVLGMGKVGDSVRLLLDVDRVLGGGDAVAVETPGATVA